MYVIKTPLKLAEHIFFLIVFHIKKRVFDNLLFGWWYLRVDSITEAINWWLAILLMSCPDDLPKTKRKKITLIQFYEFIKIARKMGCFVYLHS